MQLTPYKPLGVVQCGVRASAAQCGASAVQGGKADRYAMAILMRHAIIISKRWDLDVHHFTLTRIPSLCKVNSGAYMHWMVVRPLL